MQIEILPELELAQAIIERAVLDAAGSTAVGTISRKTGKQAKEAAREWLFEWTEEDEEIPFTFPWLCVHLERDPIEVSRRIWRLLEEPGVRKSWGGRCRRLFLISTYGLDTTATAQEVYI
jgi:hypothetical protein